MPKYMTQQRRELLSFFENHIDEKLSAKEISDKLKDKNISVSAVYRNLAELEKNGMVRRLSKKGSREVFYQYIDEHKCRECLHLSCEKCGKTFHMNIDGANALVKSVENNDDFAIDKANTILYGICKNCQKVSEK